MSSRNAVWTTFIIKAKLEREDARAWITLYSIVRSLLLLLELSNDVEARICEFCCRVLVEWKGHGIPLLLNHRCTSSSCNSWGKGDFGAIYIYEGSNWRGTFCVADVGYGRQLVFTTWVRFISFSTTGSNSSSSTEEQVFAHGAFWNHDSRSRRLSNILAGRLFFCRERSSTCRIPRLMSWNGYHGYHRYGDTVLRCKYQWNKDDRKLGFRGGWQGLLWRPTFWNVGSNCIRMDEYASFFPFPKINRNSRVRNYSRDDVKFFQASGFDPSCRR